MTTSTKIVYTAKAIRAIAAVIGFISFLGLCDESVITTSLTYSRKALALFGFFGFLALYNNADTLAKMIFENKL